MIGEAYLPIDRMMAYYGADLTGFQLPFNFHLIFAEWSPSALAKLIETYEAALPPGAWPNWVLGNHDRPRVASRIGPDQARVAAMLLLTLRGTPTIYQGEEIGMTNVAVPPELVQDPWERNVPGLGLGRDPVRTPMPWTGEAKGGFTTGQPWLPLGERKPGASVAVQAEDPRSMLSLYRALLRLRRAEPALAIGSFEPVAATDRVLAFRRAYRGRQVLVALNLGGDPAEVPGPFRSGTILLSTHLDRSDQPTGGTLSLRPHEGCVLAPDGS